ncbi:MAG: nitroreductase [Anaerolineae bacterium]|nr:nitroreductase [Anaerolineae bacterium]
MNTFDAIAQRRSIRRFKDTPITDELIEQLLTAATQAPSGKNIQPWRFIVVKEDKRAEMVRIMRQGIESAQAQGMSPGSSVGSAKIMEQAPVTIFVFNANGIPPDQERTVDDTLWDAVNIQSIGAAIQNMLLAAQDLGIGTLWICDVFYAYGELCAWLEQTSQLIAAVSLGYPDEQPNARPRKPLDEVTTWL